MVFISFIHLCFSDSDPFFRQQIVRRGGFVSLFYFIHFFRFTDYRKRKSVAAEEEGTHARKGGREGEDLI